LDRRPGEPEDREAVAHHDHYERLYQSSDALEQGIDALDDIADQVEADLREKLGARTA
jgi:hypothetical protein